MEEYPKMLYGKFPAYKVVEDEAEARQMKSMGYREERWEITEGEPSFEGRDYTGPVNERLKLQCDICGKRVAHAGQLQQHMVVHQKGRVKDVPDPGGHH